MDEGEDEDADDDDDDDDDGGGGGGGGGDDKEAKPGISLVTGVLQSILFAKLVAAT